MHKSIWRETVNFPRYPTLSGDVETEVAIIGGGLAGLLTAWFLRERGMQALVLEARTIGSGQTQNTTAKITAQHNLIYDRLVRQLGQDLARQYADANQQAVEAYRHIIEGHHIDCHFEHRPAYLYTTRDPAPLKNEARAAKLLGLHADFTTDAGLPFPVTGAVRLDGQAQFHPLEFLHAIAKPLTIYEQTLALSVQGHTVQTERGQVKAKHIVFATHFPFPLTPGLYFARMHQERSYVLALEHAIDLPGMYLGVDPDGLSMRMSGQLLLLGGGGHRTGENRPGGKYEQLRQEASRLWPQSREVASWSAQDCMTLDEVPYIGPFAASHPDWYVATGFGKWGMTSSMVAARLLTDLISGGDSPHAQVFSPQRFTPAASLKNLLSDTMHAMRDLSREVLSPPRALLDALPLGHGGVVEWEGQKAGVYKEPDGTLHVVSTRCPHLGCQVEWNPDEQSWDCPCHGSRFDRDGRLLDGPAQTNLTAYE